MPNIDLTVTISVIVALCAIISPILTTIINNLFQLKLKRLESSQKRYEDTVLHKREIFENFLSAFNQVCQLPTNEAIAQYSSSYSLVYVYLPKKVRDDLGTVNLLINNKKYNEAIKYVDAISMDICKEMENQCKQK